MKKVTKILIFISSLIAIVIILLNLLIYGETGNTPTFDDYPQFNFIYPNETMDIPKTLSETQKIIIATGCDSIFVFLYSEIIKDKSKSYYNVSIITNKNLVKELILQINPFYLPNFNRDEIEFYFLNKTNYKFERDNQTRISNFINVSKFCPPKTPPKHAIITSNFSETIGIIDENGNLQKI